MNELVQDPEIGLAIAYMPAALRGPAETVFALDAQLGNILRTTTEPMIGAMRLTWWRDSIEALGGGVVPDEPLLQRVSAELSGTSVDLVRLSNMAEGWIPMLNPMPLDRIALQEFARLRGGVMFVELGRLLGHHGEHEMLGKAGEGWALVDFAFRCSERETAEAAVTLAVDRLAPALSGRWPSTLRPLGALGHLALRDARAGIGQPRPVGSPARLFRALRHRITGR